MTWATSVPILVFVGLSVVDLGPMYATDRRRQTSDAHHRLVPPLYGGGGIMMMMMMMMMIIIIIIVCLPANCSGVAWSTQ